MDDYIECGYVSMDGARGDGSLSANKAQLRIACDAGFRTYDLVA